MMTTANHPSLAREVAAEVTSSAKWYGIAAVAGCIGGALFGLYDYTPPAPPEPAAVVAPAAIQPAPVFRPVQEQDPALVAGEPMAHAAAVRHEPLRCVDQVRSDGHLMGTLCQPDPGGVAGSAMGANQPAGAGGGRTGSTFR